MKSMKSDPKIAKDGTVTDEIKEAPADSASVPPSVHAFEKTEADKAADARNSIGGQGAAGSSVPEDKQRIHSDEVAKSNQPKAPEHPLESPKAPVAEVFDNTPPAETSEAPKE